MESVCCAGASGGSCAGSGSACFSDGQTSTGRSSCSSGSVTGMCSSGSAGMGFGWRAGSGAFSGAAFRAGTCTGEASAADKYDGSSTKTETGFAAGRMT